MRVLLNFFKLFSQKKKKNFKLHGVEKKTLLLKFFTFLENLDY